MRIAVAADHAGLAIKRLVAEFLVANGDHVEDLGRYRGTRRLPRLRGGGRCRDPDRVLPARRADLRQRRRRLGRRQQAPRHSRGLCHDTYSAHQGVEHDDMNVLVLGGRVIGEALARELVLAFTTATFTNEERHRRRLAKVHQLEEAL